MEYINGLEEAKNIIEDLKRIEYIRTMPSDKVLDILQQVLTDTINDELNQYEKEFLNE